MRLQLRSIVGGTLGLGCAVLLLAPSQPISQAYVLSGDALGLGQRDVRVYDNFENPVANGNLIPDPNFPGYTGAELAIWKACVEWGSGLHGTGEGDPHQPGGLGSGGANFDPSWQGMADNAVNGNGNTHSAVTGCSPGLLAYAELPTSNGWRIRYCDKAWTFDDGPGAFLPGPGSKDLQGVAVHEYGHALGLGHSSDPIASMATPVLGNGVDARSLQPDDIAGVQAIYGVKASDKPEITSASFGAGLVTIVGSNFSDTGNEVWFTQKTTGGDGTPVRVFDASATNGTIVVSLPAEAGSGDVLVKRAGTGFSALSNAWPLDTTGGLCGATQYGLGLGGANIGSLAAANQPVAGEVFTLEISGFNGSGSAKLIVAPSQSSQAFIGGTVLIYFQGPFTMITIDITDGAATLNLPMPMLQLVGYAQVGMPDASMPAGWALSNGLEISICP